MVFCANVSLELVNLGGYINKLPEKVSIPLLGMNGSGKGIQALALQMLGFKPISCSGAMNTIKERNPEWCAEIDLSISRGLYVPDHITIPVIDQIFFDFGEDGIPDRLVLDGSVRTIAQGERVFGHLRRAEHAIIVVYVDVSEEVCFARSLARKRGIDDTEEVIRVRFGQYNTYTAPTVEWVRKQLREGDMFVTIEDGTIEQMVTQLLTALGYQDRVLEIAARIETERALKKQ